jgi:hypothetical protein
MYGIAHPNLIGNLNDMAFMYNDKWLLDTEVSRYIYEQKGRWKIIMIFTWALHPTRFICRYMVDDFPTKNKAEIFANFYTRTSQKDIRGTLTLNTNDFNICFN